MKTFNELSEVTITARAVDNDGALFTPTNARYRLDDLLSRNALIAWTSLTAASSMQIVIPASAHAMVNSSRKDEVKVLTVETDFGLTSAHPEEYEYKIKNLHFVS